MKDINDIFNDFMLSMVNEKNATLIQELRVRWRHYLGQVSYPLTESKPLQRTPLPSPDSLSKRIHYLEERVDYIEKVLKIEG